MTRDELLALPVVIDLDTAATALGIGRTKAHELARKGEFPVPVLRLGVKRQVPTEPLLELLGIRGSVTTTAPVAGPVEVVLAPGEYVITVQRRELL